MKPANLGSSVGMTKAHDRAELGPALELAAAYDRKVIVEAASDGRELECSLLGNDDAARLGGRRGHPGATSSTTTRPSTPRARCRSSSPPTSAPAHAARAQRPSRVPRDRRERVRALRLLPRGAAGASCSTRSTRSPA